MEYLSPGETLDFLHDLTDWLPSGDSLQSALWDIGGGLVLASQNDTTTGSTVVLTAGSQAGITAYVTCTATTANGLVSPKTWFVTIQEQII